MATNLNSDIARRFAQIALAHVEREYPHKLDQTIERAEDIRLPRQLHPVFYGSFDWHSAVHTHWLLLAIYKDFPHVEEAGLISCLFDRQFDPDKIAGEVDFIRANTLFERPYGWGWLLKLVSELSLGAGGDMARWLHSLRPLSDLLSSRLSYFLRYVQYPIRSGAHYNSAFSLLNFLDYAKAIGSEDLVASIADTARRWFGDDINCQSWEPGGEDFLSPTLTEALLMKRVLSHDDFVAWFFGFLPLSSDGEPFLLFRPAQVSDRADGKIAHLDGLNLSRAWCLRSLARAFKDHPSLRVRLLTSADEHINASLPYISVHYSGGHWLSTYAMLALRA